VGQDNLFALIRHILTASGGSLITAGYVSSTQWADIVGGAMAVGGVAWSLWQKRQQRQAVLSVQAKAIPNS
jgi:hypothetical protein